MNCKNFVIRSKKNRKYKFCKLNKKEINFEDCRECQDKEYRKYKKLKKQKHKRTKATDIQDGIKEAVWNRDNHKCIFCQAEVSLFHANAHFIPRSHGRTWNRRKYIYSLWKMS